MENPTPLTFHLSALDTDFEMDKLTYFTAQPTQLKYDQSVTLDIPINDVLGMILTIHNENWNPINPNNEDISISVNENFGTNIFQNLLNISNGVVSRPLSTVVSGDHNDGNRGTNVQTIVSDMYAKNGGAYYKHVAIVDQLTQIYGYNVISLMSNESDVANNIDITLNNAIATQASAAYNTFLGQDEAGNYFKDLAFNDVSGNTLANNIRTIFEQISGNRSDSLVNIEQTVKDNGYFDLTQLFVPGDKIQMLANINASPLQKSFGASSSTSPVYPTITLITLNLQ